MKFLLPARVAESIFFATGLANKTLNFLGFLFFTLRTNESTSMYFYFFTSSFLSKASNIF